MKPALTALSAAAILATLGGCGIFGSNGPKGTPTVGTRIPVLTAEAAVEADPELADVPVTLPPAEVNADWAQGGGSASKSMGHVALGTAPAAAWSVGIGQGSSQNARLAAAPVVGGGRVYTIDSQAVIRAFNPDNGSVVWQHQLTSAQASGRTHFGGGVSFDGGRVYAVNGAGDAAALDAATGAVVWQVRPGGPLRGAPTVAADTVYVVSQDNQLYALNVANGEQRWTRSGAAEASGVFGVASPAFAQSTVVAGYSSGELAAYRYENGQEVWSDALTRTSVTTSVSALSDIDADPVIDHGRVFAIGQGGRMVAVELNTGQRLWELNVAGIATPWVAGDWVFVVTEQAQLLAIARASGRVRWISQLQRWRNAEDRRGPITWRGPVLAGGRLVLVSSLGHIVFASPADGSVQATVNGRAPISLPPVVANNTLYILDDNGRLTAYR
ncbi:MAG: outer membrane protein assembly factor BamB [Sphingomonadales bacterium]|jgi:outer membrane protein assembly factor BamB|nr:outer membrane protein assembly factor BamB [Sphingomonadales bacterium]